jgi:hypothetical protein
VKEEQSQLSLVKRRKACCSHEHFKRRKACCSHEHFKRDDRYPNHSGSLNDRMCDQIIEEIRLGSPVDKDSQYPSLLFSVPKLNLKTIHPSIQTLTPSTSSYDATPPLPKTNTKPYTVKPHLPSRPKTRLEIIQDSKKDVPRRVQGALHAHPNLQPSQEHRSLFVILKIQPNLQSVSVRDIRMDNTVPLLPFPPPSKSYVAASNDLLPCPALPCPAPSSTAPHVCIYAMPRDSSKPICIHLVDEREHPLRQHSIWFHEIRRRCPPSDL